ncbi:MAG: YeiH family protein, partial [Candidatus Baltobacteraceae bacterium]
MKRFLPGAALWIGIAIAVAAYFLGRSLPLVGGPVFAVVIGMLVRPLVRRFEPFAAGIGFSTKMLLQISIVLLGLNLSLVQIWRSGMSSLPVMLGTMAIVLLAAYPLGKLLRVQSTPRSLISIGTAICGASAIAATSMVLEASESDIAYAIATVFLFNILAVLIFP